MINRFATGNQRGFLLRGVPLGCVVIFFVGFSILYLLVLISGEATTELHQMFWGSIALTALFNVGKLWNWITGKSGKEKKAREAAVREWMIQKMMEVPDERRKTPCILTDTDIIREEVEESSPDDAAAETKRTMDEKNHCLDCGAILTEGAAYCASCGKLSFGKATGRTFGKMISTMIWGIGFLMASFTKQRQALHDMMAGCLVVKKKK